MWLNCKVITKKWQPPPPHFCIKHPPSFRFIPLSGKNFCTPPCDSIFGRSAPPPLYAGGWGGGGPTMLVVKCLGNFTFKIQIHFWNSLSNTCLVNMRRFSLPKFSDFLWWNFTSIYRPDVFYLSSSLSLKISKKDCLTN